MNLPEEYEEIESAVREAVAAKCASVEGIGHVFPRRFLVTGKQQYVEMLGIANDATGDIEIQCCFVEFAGFEDTERGCDEAPNFYLLYSIRPVLEFVDGRADGSNSSDDYARLVMRLRAAFLVERRLGFASRVYHDPLKQTRRVALEDDALTGVFGHTSAYLLRVEVTPYG